MLIARDLLVRGFAMIRSYNHKGFVLEVAVQASYRLVSTSAPETAQYLAVVTISRSGRPVTSFSPLYVAQRRIGSFDTAEDALLSAQSAGQTFVDEWMLTAH
jgi:hypothetical protein